MTTHGELSRRRRAAGFLLAIIAGPLLTWLLVSVHRGESLTVDALSLQLLTVVVAMVGGIWPALFTAVLAGLALDFFFIEPIHTVAIDHAPNIVTILLCVAIAILVSAVVDSAAKRSRAAASDKVHTALLASVSHDLRRPLASATAAVSGLRAAGDSLSPADRDELIATADQSLTALTDLVTDLLDASRLQAGVLAVSIVQTDPGDVILPALEEAGAGPGEVALDIDPRAPAMLADPALLRRALVNLLANALRHRPAHTTVRLSVDSSGEAVRIRIADHGPGVPAQRRDEMFVAFQRLGDADNTTGLGLGLALSKGFVEGMGGTLTPEDTPGGGLTMSIRLPAANRDGSIRDTADTA